MEGNSEGCRRFRILTIVDDRTRECLALVADTSLSGARLARELDRLMIERGKVKPNRIRRGAHSGLTRRFLGGEKLTGR
jgi:transposase InsO family protein